jgi:hypothetical protein
MKKQARSPEMKQAMAEVQQQVSEFSNMEMLWLADDAIAQLERRIVEQEEILVRAKFFDRAKVAARVTEQIGALNKRLDFARSLKKLFNQMEMENFAVDIAEYLRSSK